MTIKIHPTQFEQSLGKEAWKEWAPFSWRSQVNAHGMTVLLRRAPTQTASRHSASLPSKQLLAAACSLAGGMGRAIPVQFSLTDEGLHRERTETNCSSHDKCGLRLQAVATAGAGAMYSTTAGPKDLVGLMEQPSIGMKREWPRNTAKPIAKHAIDD